ncbi:hypothetical protein D3C71_1582010 [compost metagenome]
MPVHGDPHLLHDRGRRDPDHRQVIAVEDDDQGAPEEHEAVEAVEMASVAILRMSTCCMRSSSMGLGSQFLGASPPVLTSRCMAYLENGRCRRSIEPVLRKAGFFDSRRPWFRRHAQGRGAWNPRHMSRWQPRVSVIPLCWIPSRGYTSAKHSPNNSCSCVTTRSPSKPCKLACAAVQ